MLEKRKYIFKRIAACALIISMTGTNVYALEPANVAGQVIRSSMESEIVANENILFYDGARTMQLEPDSIGYSYVIEDGTSANTVAVTMDMSMNYLSNSESFEVTGEIPVFRLSSGIEYMYGPLEGEVNLDGVNYKATVGFQKMGNNSAISATLTMKCDDNEVVFKFGDLHVKYEAIEEILTSSTDETSISVSSTREASQGNYQYMTSAVEQLNNKNAIEETISYYAGKRRLMLTVTPYLQNIENIHTVSGTTTAAVSVDRIKMSILEKDSSQTYINGLVVGDTSPIGESGGTTSGKNALNVLASIGSLKFPDAAAGLSVFTALVDALVSTGVKATLVKGADAVSAEYNNLNLADKTWDQYGVSLACQLQPFSAPSPTVKAVYNYWSEIRYSVAVTDNMGDVSHVYRTVEVSKDYTITTT